jgi:polyhydroxybutyrate depolymerase
MNPIADDNGFIVVYPDSPTNSWNAGTCCDFNDPTRDDVGLARALVQEIQSKACIDPKRIYTTGMSNGAFMSYRLGCEAADLFAAIAPVAGKVGIPNCSPSRPVPLMAFHGTSDPLVAYDTGSLSADNLSVPDTVKKWADGDGCTGDPQVTYQQGTVTCNTWSTCKDGATVTLCTAQGEGHCWPGTALCPFGAYTTDINASQEIAKFFAKFSLP